MCIVEVEGSRNPVASCTANAASGMRVKTAGGRLDMHRRVLLEMVTSENREIDVDPLSGYASQELKVLADKYDARSGRFGGKQSGQSFEEPIQIHSSKEITTIAFPAIDVSVFVQNRKVIMQSRS